MPTSPGLPWSHWEQAEMCSRKRASGSLQLLRSKKMQSLPAEGERSGTHEDSSIRKTTVHHKGTVADLTADYQPINAVISHDDKGSAQKAQSPGEAERHTSGDEVGITEGSAICLVTARARYVYTTERASLKTNFQLPIPLGKLFSGEVAFTYLHKYMSHQHSHLPVSTLISLKDRLASLFFCSEEFS